jgi:hemoglobin/transferrin/lactoferrin receptor protein
MQLPKAFFQSLPLAACLHAHAAEPPATPTTTPETPALPEMTVTATRSPLATASAPAMIRELTSEQFSERLVRSLPEALRELPGVSVQKTSNGQASPFIRGLTGFRNLALIDGIRYNNSTFRDGPNQYWTLINPLSLDRVELVPGQGAVLYGSDAIGGTLNALTKASGFRSAPAGESFTSGSSFYRFASAERSHTGHLEFNAGRGGDWGLHLSATGRSFGDVQAAELGRLPTTGYDEWAYHSRFDAALSDQWSLSAVHQQSRQNDVWRTHSTIFSKSWNGSTSGTDLRRSFDQQRSLSYLRLSGQTPGQIVDSTTFTASYQTNDESAFRTRASQRRDLTETKVGTLGCDLQFTRQSPFGNLTFGADYYHDSVDSTGTSQIPGSPAIPAVQGPVGDDSSYGLLGLYLQDEITAGDRFHVFLGGRYTHASADVGRFLNPVTAAPDSFASSWDHFAGSARFVLDLDQNDRFALTGGVSQGFRAPNLSDLSRLDIARSGELEIAATSLSPEESLNFEIGLRTSTDRFTGSVVYFHNLFDQFIVRQPTGNLSDGASVVSKANSGAGFAQGIEASTQFSLTDHWSLFADLTWTEGELDQYPSRDSLRVTEPLSRVVPFMGRAGLRWQNDQFWSELVCLAASRADRLNSGDRADTDRIPPGGTPGWTLLSLRGGWNFHEHASLTASLDNLLDDAYRVHGSGSNEPGFGGSVGLTLRF